ncbi:Hint domain-containing protein [Halocynthiibacter sp.]|uniref:Hint domain-containing protein n=1 Tax=Halocynthiibacter sp. TaxID=1979210 RepID=UPI003C5DC402
MAFKKITPTDADPANHSGDVTFTLSNGTSLNLRTTTDMDYGIASPAVSGIPGTETLFSLGAETDELEDGEHMVHSLTNSSGNPVQVSGARLRFDALTDTQGTSPASVESFFVFLDGVRVNINDLIASGEATIEWGDPFGVHTGLPPSAYPFFGGSPDPNAIDPLTGSVSPKLSPDGAIHGSSSNLGLTLTITRDFTTLSLEYINEDNGLGTHYSLELDDDPVCFTADTLITTMNGPVAAAKVKPGDLLLCQDGVYRPVRWVGLRTFGSTSEPMAENCRPICISAGALGQGMPERDLLVSRQHRILLRSEIAQSMFGCDELLLAAVKLLALPGVEELAWLDTVTYVHFLMDGHQIIYAEGIAAETLLLGEQAQKAMSPDALVEVLMIFPELCLRREEMEPACFIPPPRKQKELIKRHLKNPARVLNCIGHPGASQNQCQSAI